MESLTGAFPRTVSGGFRVAVAIHELVVGVMTGCAVKQGQRSEEQ
jgi:hypothetical protein